MILLYHLVFPDSTPKEAWNAGLILRLRDFKRQLTWLNKRYKILSLEQYMQSFQRDQKSPKGAYALTFDDGYQQVFELVKPFLLEAQIPATFFATTSHLDDGCLLWFVYFNALCSEIVYDRIKIGGKTYALTRRQSSMAAWGELIRLARASGDPIAFARDFAQNYPLPEAVMAKYAGLTADQMREIGGQKDFTLGGHTHQHPYLDLISPEEQRQEILTNKHKLEAISGQPVSYFAFTGGVYNAESIKVVKGAGFEAAFAVKPKGLGQDPRFEMPRVDIYHPSMIKFKAKAYGLGDFARKLWGGS